MLKVDMLRLNHFMVYILKLNHVMVYRLSETRHVESGHVETEPSYGVQTC